MNRIIVRLKKESDYQVLLNNITYYDIDSIEQNEFDSKTYLLKLNYSSSKNAMQIANELYEKGLFEYAEPDLLLFIKYATNDAYFSQQWALNNTGQFGGTNGVDIKANQAWNITTGSPNIKIAILDSGVDFTHPDLVNNLLTGYDAAGGNNNGNQSFMPHGTACAGIAAAQANNTIGIAGVAHNCRILPVLMSDVPLASQVSNGLNWARTNGAKVVSMSFYIPETNSVNTALSQAAASGCVLVAASGNDNVSTTNYPARNPNVIAVGAINRNGQRASFSNYGTNLDIVAPGTNIYTTDICGNDGYTENNYYSDFDGTSAACPHVAGVAALVLSVRPDLTQAQVRQVLESTCTKLTNYTFSAHASHPNGTWHSEVEHGLVNAYEAVSSVVISMSGPSQIHQSATYTLVNAPAGGSITWVTSSNMTILSQNNQSATVTFNFTGTAPQTGYISATVNSNGQVFSFNKTVTQSGVSISGMPELACYVTENYYPSVTGLSSYKWYINNTLVTTLSYLRILTRPIGTLPINAPSPNINNDIVDFSENTAQSFNGISQVINTPENIAQSPPFQFITIKLETYNSSGSIYSTATMSVRVCGEYEVTNPYPPNPPIYPPNPPNPPNPPIYPPVLPPAEVSPLGGGDVTVVYPNPVSDVLNIEINSIADTLQPLPLSKLQTSAAAPVSDVKLYNQSGTLVRSLSAADTQIQLNVADLPAGIYYLHVSRKGKTPEIKTIIVSR